MNIGPDPPDVSYTTGYLRRVSRSSCSYGVTAGAAAVTRRAGVPGGSPPCAWRSACAVRLRSCAPCATVAGSRCSGGGGGAVAPFRVARQSSMNPGEDEEIDEEADNRRGGSARPVLRGGADIRAGGCFTAADRGRALAAGGVVEAEAVDAAGPETLDAPPVSPVLIVHSAASPEDADVEGLPSGSIVPAIPKCPAGWERHVDAKGSPSSSSLGSWTRAVGRIPTRSTTACWRA